MPFSSLAECSTWQLSYFLLYFPSLPRPSTFWLLELMGEFIFNELGERGEEEGSLHYYYTSRTTTVGTTEITA